MGHSRLNWTLEQQHLLKLLKQEAGLPGWKQIAEELNKKFESKNRTGKQCRERYMNYIKFESESLKALAWTKEQDAVLFKNFQIYGARWVLISRQMPGRSENSLKNRFYGILRKIMRKIQKVIRTKKVKQSKGLKLNALIQILESRSKMLRQQKTQSLDQKAGTNLQEQLSKQIFQLAMSRMQDPPESDVLQLVRKLHEYLSLKKIGSKRACVTSPSQRKYSIDIQFEQGEKHNIINDEEDSDKKDPKQINESRVSLGKMIELYEKAEREEKINSGQDQELSLPYHMDNGQNIIKEHTYDILDQIEGIQYFV